MTTLCKLREMLETSILFIYTSYTNQLENHLAHVYIDFQNIQSSNLFLGMALCLQLFEKTKKEFNVCRKKFLDNSYS